MNYFFVYTLHCFAQLSDFCIGIGLMLKLTMNQMNKVHFGQFN